MPKLYHRVFDSLQNGLIRRKPRNRIKLLFSQPACSLGFFQHQFAGNHLAPETVHGKMEGAIVLPHLGASTAEAEDNCAIMAVNELRNFIENGNIVNSVNYPNCDCGVCATKGRITVCHKNVPAVISKITTVLEIGRAHV